MYNREPEVRGKYLNDKDFQRVASMSIETRGFWMEFGRLWGYFVLCCFVVPFLNGGIQALILLLIFMVYGFKQWSIVSQYTKEIEYRRLNNLNKEETEKYLMLKKQGREEYAELYKKYVIASNNGKNFREIQKKMFELHKEYSREMDKKISQLPTEMNGKRIEYRSSFWKDNDPIKFGSNTVVIYVKDVDETLDVAKDAWDEVVKKLDLQEDKD